MSRRKVVHRQPPVRGGRDRRTAYLLDEISKRLQQDADQFGVSPSWVQATILAKHYRIADQVDYRTLRKEGQFGQVLKMVRSR